MRILKCLASLPIAALLVMAAHSSAFADETTTSPDGTLTMTHNHRSGCKTGRISGTYRTKSGVSGVLYEIDCGQEGDVAHFFFMDTQGSEQCYGKMTEGWGGRGGESTRWEVLGAVPGEKCSSVGQTLKQDGMR
jgi:hypothetical protein